MRPPRDGEYAWIRWYPRNVPTSVRFEIAKWTQSGGWGWWDICGDDSGYDNVDYVIEVLAYVPEYSAPDFKL